MTSRRTFLGAVTAGLGVAAFDTPFALAADAGAPPEAKTAWGPPVGLQLYSLRADAPKDVPGTLARVRALGIVEVESAGLYGMEASAFRGALDKAGLRCRGAHMPFPRLSDDAAGVLKEAKALGAS